MTRVALGPSVIDIAALTAAVQGADCGAVSLFVGAVRNQNGGRPVTAVEYTAYEAMAIAEMQKIVAELEAAEPGLRVAVRHRTGLLAIGEASVVIAAAHPHRAPALAATARAIEELKRRVPIWKREHYADGTREWVHASQGTSAAGSAGAAGVVA